MDSTIGDNLIITLKGIDTENLNTRYRSGAFISATVPREKVIIRGKKQTSLSLPGNDPCWDDIYIIRTNCKGSISYATTNCLPYKTYTREGKEVKGGKCNWCWKEFSHYRMAIILSIIQDSSTDNKYMAHWEGCNCGFRCAYSEAKLLSGDPVNTDKYNDAMSNIKQLFEKCYPGKTLIEAPDYFLFTTRGGSIDPDKYDSYIFIPQPDIIMVPIKRIFEMRKISSTETSTEIPKKPNSKHKKEDSDSES